MKKFFALMLIFGSVILLSAFKCAPVCTGCKNIEVFDENGLYVFHIPAAGKYVIRPYISEKLVFNSDVYKKTGAELVINAGYFDPKNQQTSSFVTIDGVEVLNPETNKNLTENKNISSHMRQVLNRTEFRVMDCSGQTRYDIASHKARLPFRCELVHSIQAGPLLYPDLRLEAEYFVATKGTKVTRNSISAFEKCARTAIGIKDNDVFIIIATNKHPLTLPELADVCRDLCLDKAMNFDGGGSTSVDFRGTQNQKFKNLHIVSDSNKNARKLKSFLVVK